MVKDLQGPCVMNDLVLSDKEFQQYRGMIFEIAGISMSNAKKPLVSGRLAKRVRQHDLASYGEYFRLLGRDRAEQQVAVDLLTTNETYFFREPKHFGFLRERIVPELSNRTTLRVWSGACSSGEEPYSIAMTLAETLGNRPWELLASDLSMRVLDKARSGLYPMADAQDIPRPLLVKYCLKGIGENAGTLLIDPALRKRMSFQHINLNAVLPDLGEFEVIFLRNVMIYFDLETKRQVMKRMLPLLRPGGYFIVSHSESLNGVCDQLQVVVPSIYRKPHA